MINPDIAHSHVISFCYNHFESVTLLPKELDFNSWKTTVWMLCYDTTTPKITFGHYNENCHCRSNILIIYGDLQHPKRRHCWYTTGSAWGQFNYSEYFHASAQDINDYAIITSINNNGQYFYAPPKPKTEYTMQSKIEITPSASKWQYKTRHLLNLPHLELPNTLLSKANHQ